MLHASHSTAFQQPSGVPFASLSAPWEMRFAGHPRNQDAHFTLFMQWDLCHTLSFFSLSLSSCIKACF